MDKLRSNTTTEPEVLVNGSHREVGNDERLILGDQYHWHEDGIWYTITVELPNDPEYFTGAELHEVCDDIEDATTYITRKV